MYILCFESVKIIGVKFNKELLFTCISHNDLISNYNIGMKYWFTTYTLFENGFNLLIYWSTKKVLKNNSKLQSDNLCQNVCLLLDKLPLNAFWQSLFFIHVATRRIKVQCHTSNGVALIKVSNRDCATNNFYSQGPQVQKTKLLINCR